MSGHSKWHSIKHKKGILDAHRGKIFTRHARLITIAARQDGGNPLMNPSLRLAIDNAKADNVPNVNIERAIKKGAGKPDEEAEITEIIYEGYGPFGIALIVRCLTDNKSRTIANLRTIFGKNGGNIGAQGSVSYLFERKGVIVFEVKKPEAEALEFAAIDAGAEDIQVDEDLVTVYTSPQKFDEIRDKLNGFPAKNAEIGLVPKTTVLVTDVLMARKIMSLVNALEDDQDICDVSSNFDIPENIMAQL